ncbi:MAG: hypothetical protein RIK87_17855 [Fuerstiella sp.]
MSGKKHRIPYRCSFCRERLTKVDLEGADYFRLLLLLRPYQCPHCFQTAHRPFAWIGRLPLLGRLAQGTAIQLAKHRPGVLPQRDGDISPISRRIAMFGHWVRKWEDRLLTGLAATFRTLWAVLWFLPGLMLRSRKGRRRSRGRFLKPGR